MADIFKTDLLEGIFYSLCRSRYTRAMQRKIPFLLEKFFRFLIYISKLSHGNSENILDLLYNLVSFASIPLQIEDNNEGHI